MQNVMNLPSSVLCILLRTAGKYSNITASCNHDALHWHCSSCPFISNTFKKSTGGALSFPWRYTVWCPYSTKQQLKIQNSRQMFWTQNTKLSLLDFLGDLGSQRGNHNRTSKCAFNLWGCSHQQTMESRLILVSGLQCAPAILWYSQLI